MKRAGLFISILLLTTASFSSAQPTPTVYVAIPDEDDVSDAQRRELADSARDLREQLKKRSNTEAAASRKSADVLVTLLERRIEVNESGRNDWGGALSQTHYQSRYILFFRLQSAETIEESEIALAGAFVTWKRVAGVLAKDVEVWARRN